MRPKDTVSPAKQYGLVYRIPCECGKVYIGETGRSVQERVKEHDRDIRLALTQTSAVSGHANMTVHHPLGNEVKFIDRDSHWYTRTLITSIGTTELKFLKRGYQRSRNTTGDRYISEPPREQLQIGPLGKQLHNGTIRIETHQSQPTIVVHMVTSNQSTSSPDED